MGNASGRESGGGGAGGGGEEPQRRVNGDSRVREEHVPSTRVLSTDLMVHSPPRSTLQSRSPLSFASQVPAVPLQGNGPAFFSQLRRNETQATNQPLQQGIPTLITWNYGGNNVEVEGSWDNWRSRKPLERSGKDHTIILVLSSGIYHYKFIVDGNVRYIPDLPFEADDMGNVVNLLDVHDYVPENFESATEFNAPPSPESSYNQALLRDEDFAKEPALLPPQLHEAILGRENVDEAASSSPKPQNVVLNHLYLERGRASQSVVALGLSHRFQSKYVTVVLYKPLNS